MNKRSKVHSFFNKVSTDKVECLKCALRLSVKHGTTRVLRNHLHHKHPVDYEKLLEEETSVKKMKTERVNVNNGFLDICRLL